LPRCVSTRLSLTQTRIALGWVRVWALQLCSGWTRVGLQPDPIASLELSCTDMDKRYRDDAI